MLPKQSLVDQKRSEVLESVYRNRGVSIALFGSVARGDDHPNSDIDFLVKFEPGSSLFDLLHLQDELEEILGCKVDVVSEGGLKDKDQHIRDQAVAV